jgi:periplasmic divalent cation tolerance protein
VTARAVHVQFTIDDEAARDAIVDELLRGRLVACAQTVGPLTSRYRWEGEIAEAREWLVVCKTVPARVDSVVETIRARHPYDVPEIVVGEITGGLAAYLDWVGAETSEVPPPAS